MENQNQNFDRNQPELRELLEENLKYAKAVYWSVEKVRRHLFWQRVVSIIYIIMILAPLIIAAIYLPPFISTYLGPYMELLQWK